MSALLTEDEPSTAGWDARRVVFMAAAVLVTGFLAWLALFLGAWAFEYRGSLEHNRRLQKLMAQKPLLEQVVAALEAEGSPLVASPGDEAALRAEAVRLGKGRAAEIVENGRRFPQARIFLAGDRVYFIYFDDAGIMSGFTCVSR